VIELHYYFLSIGMPTTSSLGNVSRKKDFRFQAQNGELTSDVDHSESQRDAATALMANATNQI